MNISVVREDFFPDCTMGRLSLDGAFFAYTCEDVVRENGVKVFGETAIPAGNYPVTLAISKHFGIVLPLLGGVPGFAGIRIHGGNSSKDTEGCILVGFAREGETLSRALEASRELVRRLTAAPGPHSIAISNVVPGPA